MNKEIEFLRLFGRRHSAKSVNYYYVLVDPEHHGDKITENGIESEN